MSPDGRLLAFRARRGSGGTTLWIRPLDALDAHELPGTEDGDHLFWSPDSRTVGFFADGKLKTIPAAGGPVRIVCDMPEEGGAGTGGAWNEDGTILFASPAGLHRVPAAGGRPVEVTRLSEAEGEVYHDFPHFLPDGRRFLYSTNFGRAVFLASLDSSERTQVLSEAWNAWYTPPGYLVFVRQDTILAQPFDASTGTISGDPMLIASQVDASSGSPVLSGSATGVLMYRAAGESRGAPIWVDRQGRALGSPVGDDVATALFPRLSPDGRRLALVVDGDLWVYDLEGRPPIRLTFDGDRAPRFSPLWSPDGRRLIYEAGVNLWSLPADGSSATPQLFSPDGHFHPHAWLSGGRELLAVHFASDSLDLVTLPADGPAPPTPFVQTPASEGWGAALSPDGRWLAYTSNSTGSTEIWVRPFPGPGAAVRVSPATGTQPSWSADGRELFYVEGRRFMAAAVQAGGDGYRTAPPVPLFENTHAVLAGQPPTYAVAPDGRFLLIQSATPPGTQPIIVVLNWVEELKRRAEGN